MTHVPKGHNVSREELIKIFKSPLGDLGARQYGARARVWRDPFSILKLHTLYCKVPFRGFRGKTASVNANSLPLSDSVRSEDLTPKRVLSSIIIK
ncbi:MAG: hypothetical protein K0R51_2083 [Cytophagaceae bacterium]|jgi:hypothetical protein|nr:hypothetical protein [Cytophagaceae bacterium]